MNPETTKKILETPYGKELTKYIAQTVMELDSIEDIDLNDAQEATIEMKARKRAGEKLQKIFGELLIAKDFEQAQQQKNEYAVDVE